MSDDKGDNITDPAEEVATEAQATPDTNVEAADGAENKLDDLMADPAAPAEPKPKKPAVDLEAEALRAAEQALKQGEQVLAEANAQLQQPAASPQAKPAAGGRRELALRMLLAVNVLAMVVVAMLPSPADSTPPVGPEVGKTETVSKPKPQAPTMSEPWNRALRASERRDFASAVAILEAYLDDKPRMAPSERLSVLSALSFYSARDKDFAKSRLYTQKAQALEQSHSLPEDLVKEAAAALETGDQESLRRIWARFLLQQRQIPSWLYQHVAQAYLELGDSYRKDADAAERMARERELEEAAARLRAEAFEQGGGK
ncbi:MAG: hypothetical protein KAI24_16725 [Planctomycetes bacterium]|nr:hypothetical protein [Planctomycetota bacterium]